MQAEVVQRVLAERGSTVRGVDQYAEGGPTEQEVRASDESIIEDVKQERRSF